MSAPEFATIRDGRVDLWVHVRSVVDGMIVGEVINGLWTGHFENDEVYVVKTQAVHPAVIAWWGCAPFSAGDYNAAIAWIQDQLNKEDA